MRPQRRLVAGLTSLLIVAAAAMACLASMGSVALAENPIYCEEKVGLNVGCKGPTGYNSTNEARNENGGCISTQIWVSGYGYSPPNEACNGEVSRESPPGGIENFPKCWNSTNETDLIRCRY
jgi:hypothetical protein